MRRVIFQAYADATGGKGPTPAQIGVMMMLGKIDHMSIKDVAEKFLMSSSAATQLVNPLVKDGLLTRKEDSKDRRKIGLSLTAKGKKALEEHKKIHLAVLTKIYSPLTDKELAQYLALQSKIVDSPARS